MHAFGSYPKCGHYQLSEFTNSLSEFTNCEWWGGQVLQKYGKNATCAEQNIFDIYIILK